MPRERQELIRISDIRDCEKLFLLAYEGNETEPSYFESLRKNHRFNKEIIEIVSLKRDKKDTKSAPKYVFESLRRIKDDYNITENDELWMIIDRDRNGVNIEKYFNKCLEEGNFFLALSNPCFEFWLLLHIKGLEDFNEDELKQIFENKKVKARSKKTFLKKLLSELLPDGYNESNLKPERFLNYIDTAIERAKAMRNEDEGYPLGLGSDVYKLVEKLIN